MAAIGGSYGNINIGGREFAIAADADVTTNLGGFMAEIQANGGPSGSTREIFTVKPWSIKNLDISIDEVRGDLEYLQGVIDAKVKVNITGTSPAGVSYGGLGMITGDIESSSGKATATISIGGSGKWAKV